MPADWYAAFEEGLKIGRNGLPEIVDVTQCRDIVGLASEGDRGHQVRGGACEAHEAFQKMLDATEKVGRGRDRRLAHRQREPLSRPGHGDEDRRTPIAASRAPTTCRGEADLRWTRK